MKDAVLLATLEKVFHLESRSFVRYLVEAASPTVRSEFDSRVRALVETWYRDTQGNLGILQRLFEREDFIPTGSTWSLVYTQYNFLAYNYLLGDIDKRMQSLLDEIESNAADLADWPEAQSALNGLLAAERPHLKKFRELAAERPDDEPDEGPRRKVSANFW